MDLILWRHAQAEALMAQDDQGKGDERKLTLKGEKQAAKMATWLDSVLPHGCKILVSPAKRTVQTAMALGRKFKSLPELGIDGNASQILALSGWPTGKEPVMIVGHQPQLGEIITQLVPGINDAMIRKGCVWWISQKANDEHPTTFIRAVMSPELITK